MNNTGDRVDIFIDITLLNDAGVQVGDSIAAVNGLKPGGTALWEANVYEDFDECSVRLSGVYPSN